MTVVEHLEELRRVLIVSLIAWLVGTVIAFTFNHWMLDVLLRPLKSILPQNNNLLHGAIFTSPTEGLSVPIKIAAITGFVLALPVILWQFWGFVAPGLRPAERRFAGPFLLSSLVLFACGGAFAYFVMPLGLNFLAGFLNGNATYFPDINEYLSFLVLLIVVFGITFELPVVIVLLGLLGLTSSRWLRARRKGIWVGIIAAALIVTPGADPFTPTALAIPLLIFFEAAVLILDKVLKR
jgi:sec-independent protein translocase protein TatC